MHGGINHPNTLDNVTQTSWVALPNVLRTPYPKGSDNIIQDLWMERKNGKININKRRNKNE